MKERTYEDILRAHPPRGRLDDQEVQMTPLSDTGDADGPFGVIYQDRFLTLVRDPVTFPNHSRGGHLRVLEGDPVRRRVAVVLLAIRPNVEEGFDVAWVRQWRHAVDGWATELPRGLIRPDESSEVGALRELREETGLRDPELMVHLGDMANNSGISGTIGCYYAAIYLGHQRMIQREKGETEAISNVIWSPFSEWRTVISQPGAPGRPRAPMDLFTSGAFGLAFMTGYLSRLEGAWKRMYANAAMSDDRVSAECRRRIEDGDDSPDIVVHTSGADVVRHLLRELPTLEAAVLEDAASFRVKAATRLAIEWFLSTSAVRAVELG